MLDVCFWNNNSPLQPLAERVQALLPSEGPVEDVRANPKLEKFRKAVNCYYDLFNNGLGNRAEQFRQVFGFGAFAYRRGNRFEKAMLLRLEAEMTRILIAAAMEQLSDEGLMAVQLTSPRPSQDETSA